MSYPEPDPLSSRDQLYQEAKFFYDQYEKVKSERDEMLRTAKRHLEVKNNMLELYGDCGLFDEPVTEQERAYPAWVYDGMLAGMALALAINKIAWIGSGDGRKSYRGDEEE